MFGRVADGAAVAVAVAVAVAAGRAHERIEITTLPSFRPDSTYR